MSNLGSLVISLEANIAKYTSDMGKAAAIAEARAKQIDKSIGIVKTALQSIGFAFAIGATFDKLKEKISGAIESAAGLQQLSERTGASVEALSGLAGVAKLSGTSTDDLATGLQKLSKSMVDAENGGKKTSASFDAIGISAADLVGKKPDQVFQMVARALAEYQDGAEKLVITTNLLGKSGANLLPVFNDLAEAGDLQVKTTAAQAAVADEYDKNLIRLKASSDAIYKVIALELLPVFNAFTKALIETSNANDGVKKTVQGLAKDNSIRDWAEGAVRAVGFVIDSFDGASRAVVIVGKYLGAAAAQGSLLASGEFKKALAVGEELKKDIDAIVGKTFFSERLKKQIAESHNAVGSKSPRAKINTSGLGNANDKTGPADDPAKKLLDGQLKAQESYIAAERKQLQSREQYLSYYYGQEYLDANSYYSTKQTLINDALQAELQAYAKEEAAVAVYLATADTDIKRQEAKNKQSEIDVKRTNAQVDASKQLTDVVLEQAKVYRDFDLVTRDVARREQLGNDQVRLSISLLGRNTLEVLQINEAHRLQLALEERLYQMRLKNLPLEQIQQAVSDYEAQKVAAIELVTQAYEKQRTAVFGANEAFRKYAEEAGNKAAQIDSAMTNAFKGMEDALVSFVTTGKLDFKSLADSIVADITRIIIKQQIMAPLLAQLQGGLGGGGMAGNNPSAYVGGGGGFLSGLFEKMLGGKFAGGGRPPVGVPSLVGENGPELFIPTTAGTIIPNGASAGLGGNVVNISVNQSFAANTTRATTLQAAADASRQLQYAGRNM